MITLYIKLTHKIRFTIVKIKGHNGNKYNEYVDKLAKEQRALLEDLG